MNKNILTRIHLFVLCAIIVSLITSCSGREAGSTYQYQVPSDISDGWESASLEDAGIDSKKISALMEDIQDGGFENLHSLLIVKDGRSVFEEYFRGHKQTLPDRLHLHMLCFGRNFACADTLNHSMVHNPVLT